MQKTENMIWGLEALRIFDDSLSNALTEIKKAKIKMMFELDEVTQNPFPMWNTNIC